MTSNYTMPQTREDLVNINTSRHQWHGRSWSFNRLHPFGFMIYIWFIIKGGAILNSIIFSKANAVKMISWINRIINLWLSNHIGLWRVLFLFLDNGLIKGSWIL